MRTFCIQYLNYEGNTSWTEVEVEEGQGKEDAKLKVFEEYPGWGHGIKEIIQVYEGRL